MNVANLRDGELDYRVLRVRPMPPKFKNPDLKRLANYLRAEFQEIHWHLDQFAHTQSQVGDFKSRVRKVERKVLTEDELFS
jgi:hypothetical protein